MIPPLIVLILLFLLLTISVECFFFKSKQQDSKIQKLWNKSLQESTVKVESSDEIEILIDAYKGNNEKFITGCYQAKPLITKNGDVPEWQKYSSFITQITKKNSNKNYQIFSSNSNKFFNLSEYNGNDFFATASGKYSKLENRKFMANVTEICIYFQFLQKLRKLSFNVNGNGIINIVYEDKDSYRIVKNEKGARALQKRIEIPVFYKELLKIE